MKDVEDVAWVTVKMLRLYRSFADRIPFANAYANENGGG
jgi:hypothetical protein